MPPYAPLGSISTGTLLPRNLAGTFQFELARLAKRDTQDADRKARTENALAALKPLLEQEDEAAIVALETFVNETAPELFEAYCAPFTRFGSHEGDGADFGIWPDIASLDEAARCKDGVIKVDAGDKWPVLACDIDYVMEVNDHGNVTLFCARSTSVLWSCV